MRRCPGPRAALDASRRARVILLQRIDKAPAASRFHQTWCNWLAHTPHQSTHVSPDSPHVSTASSAATSCGRSGSTDNQIARRSRARPSAPPLPWRLRGRSRPPDASAAAGWPRSPPAAATAATSVLSHRAAGQLHGVLRSAPSNPIDVIATRRHQLRGVRCHSARGLHPDDTTIVDAIPVTTVHRTFLDLAEVMHPLRLFDALELSVRLAAVRSHRDARDDRPQPRPPWAQAVTGRSSPG